MRVTFRTKLVAIVGASALAFLLLIVASAVSASRLHAKMVAIENRYLPRMELGPRLEGDFERLGRSIQDAVAARDVDALDSTRADKNALVDALDAARDIVDPNDAALLRQSIEDYYTDVTSLSRRMMDGETGEALVDAIAAMQAKRQRALDLLKKTTGFDRAELAAVFSGAAQSQIDAGRVRLVIGIACLVFVAVLSFWLSRGVLESVAELTQGFARFGEGNFAVPIRVESSDELKDVAERANRMAESLKRLNEERERTDWLKQGQVGLAKELRGSLEPGEVAHRGVRFLARHMDVPAAALFYSDRKGTLTLVGHHALSDDAGSEMYPVFKPGEGLVGQAAMHDELVVIGDPPPDYMRIRSGLGAAAPRAIALLPLLHLGKVTGVLELASFKPWNELSGDFLLSIRETLTIAIEVARARAETRELLAETQRQAERLSHQEEELQATNEELQAQQEELRQTNQELAEQAAELEDQRRILEQKNAELDAARRGLERKADELMKVSAYKSQFLANMSHELRTPLNSMLLLSNLLAENEKGNLTAKQVEFSKTIHSAGKDLLALINQVLDLAKVEAGKQEVRIADVPLQDLSEYAERVFGPLATDKGLQLQCEVSEAVPETIRTDLLRVQQILTNLLANAIKFTERGRVTLVIKRPEPGVRFRRPNLRPDALVALAVSDTGVGVPLEHQERIFVPFEQVDAASDRRYGGTGLGLSIARELTQLLGGELQLRSTPGKGSAFICYLPYEYSAPTSALPAAAASNGSTASTRAHEAKPEAGAARPSERRVRSDDSHLLIIEDDPVFADMMSSVIHAQGLKSRWAADGTTGMRWAKESKPTGIILDVKLPDVDGFTIMDQLKADPETADIPVHFVSAMEGADRGIAMGATGYLTKPATSQDLIRVVESLAPKVPEQPYGILVVEDDAPAGDSLVKQLMAENLEARRVGTAKDALEAVDRERFGCLILDLSLPDMDGLDLLQSLRDRCGAQMPAVVVYTGRALSKIEATRLDAYAEAVVLKEGSSTERLVDEIRLFVRRLKEGFGPRRPTLSRKNSSDVRLAGRKILVADDDMRTMYALSATLRAKGVDVFAADTGKAALEVLSRHPDIEAVLMDIMMPEMDGYEAMQRIRQDARFQSLPIIALTAKAMKGDKEKCLEVGATDYLPKPIDIDNLLTMLQSRLQASGHGT